MQESSWKKNNLLSPILNTEGDAVDPRNKNCKPFVCGTYLKNRSIKNQLCSVKESAIVTKSPDFNMDFMIKSRRPGLNRYPVPGPSPYHWRQMISQAKSFLQEATEVGAEVLVVGRLASCRWLFLRHFDPHQCRLSSWWLNQPIWQILVQVGSSSPRIGVKIENIWVATNQTFFLKYTFPKKNAWQNYQVAHFAIFFYKLHFRFRWSPHVEHSTDWKLPSVAYSRFHSKMYKAKNIVDTIP